MIHAKVSVEINPENPELERNLEEAATTAANSRLRNLHPAMHEILEIHLDAHPDRKLEVIEETVERVLKVYRTGWRVHWQTVYFNA